MEGLAAALRRYALVALDTPVFIYHIEGRSRYAAPAATVFDGLAAGDFEAVASVRTLMELTVKPLQMGREDIADEYEILVSNFPHLRVVEIERPVAHRAAQLRARYRLRPAEALQVASAIEYDAGAFVTNDRELQRVTDISILLLEDFVGG